MVIAYGVFLLVSSPFLLYGSYAFVDGFGIDKHLPSGLTTLLILFLPAVAFTLLGLAPLVVLKNDTKEIKKVAVILFMASFTFNVLLLFLGFMVAG
ncbi:hypothetical protein [Thermococcus sp. GR6]|uniref:hypothetical protein n=1 Tax=Thermococcus sp. GR6 TaxID=1638256 RepID=UPI001430601E|nr:hypothetical protein [Thermococcus sp. GR6]NJE42349.1 hypothetical protein [Thermococcus sp. GR6]